MKLARSSLQLGSVWLVALLALGCSSPEEAARVEVPLFVDATQLQAAASDLGYQIEISNARICVKDFTFARAGEVHVQRWLEQGYDWLVPSAYAHPGHFQGGDITGELRGEFLLDFQANASEPDLAAGEDDASALRVGEAQLLTGQYQSANFIFSRCSEAQLEPGDALLQHSAELRGRAQREGRTVDFRVVLDAPEERQLVGIPFEAEITESNEALLRLQLSVAEGAGAGNLLDGVDFFALLAADESELHLGPTGGTEASEAAYFAVRREFLTHNYYRVVAEAP